MLDFTWKLFENTGNIDTYLLFKEIEKERMEQPDVKEKERSKLDFPVL